MSEPLVRVQNASKKFCRDLKKSLWYGLVDMVAELTGSTAARELRPKEFWAVDDVSFELEKGECLGLVGPNGAGKSTLLKMLNGIIKPDRGRIEMHGRVGALIELGAGFNPILTGRENIYINGSVLGLTKHEIDRKLDDIIGFAELQDFIDTPVQNYSSGMRVRLGFSIAAQMEPDILLVDEVLAVGDVGFRIKCYNEIYRIMENAAVIFVSHSMPQLGKVCTSGILMDKGRAIMRSNNISEVINGYYNLFTGEQRIQVGSGRVRLTAVRFGNKTDCITYPDAQAIDPNHYHHIDADKPLTIGLTFTMDQTVDCYSILFSISDVDQKLVLQILPPERPLNNHPGTQEVLVTIDSLLLNTGKYSLTVHFLKDQKTDWGEILLSVQSLLKFSVQRDRYIGAAPVLHAAEWNISDGPSSIRHGQGNTGQVMDLP